LLIDVVIRKDGSILIMDTDELADALDLNLITVEEAKYALRTLDSLLKLIYRGEFKKLQTPINQAEIAYSSSII
jgi:predicted RNA-binding protein associated with RNAse of E/G family